MSDWLSTGQLQRDEEQQHQQQQEEEEATAGNATAEKANAASSGEQKTSTGSSSAARRRKSSYKPRRISPSVPERLASGDQAKCAASAVPSSDRTLMQSGNEQRLNTMIDIQESMMATSQHSAHGGGSAGKGAATPVDSPNSEYGGIRPEESSSQTGVHSPDGFINASTGGGGGAMDYSDDSHGKIAASSSSSAQNDEMKQLTASPKFATADTENSNGGGVVGHVVSQLTKQQFMPSPPQQQQQQQQNNTSSITIECKSPPKKPLTTAEQTVQNFYSASHQPFTSSPISMVTNFPMMTANPALSSKVSSVMEIAREQLGRTMQQVHVQQAEKIKKEPQVGRGMVGLGVSTVPMLTDGAQDGVPRYKRPPHTYPALIASAILDSPNRLVTLRGIYDYIMNNFPYYKFCHDKSAWQNSIRHNLSLNQCFIKVPRYENAAKSNYWTMNQEGFEEFGSENSFKRRRRRGQTIPITKGKPSKSKMNGVDQQSNNNNNDSSNNSQHQDNNNGGGNSSAPNPANYMFTPAHLMALRGGFWPSAAAATHEQAARDFSAANRLFNPDSGSLQQQQQQQNGSSDEPAAKVQRMVVLKQGDGPVLSNPAMLMGNPSLTMSTATAGLNPNSSRNPSPAGNGVKTNGLPSSLLTNGNGGNGKDTHENTQPIYLDDVKIGNEVTVHQSNGVGDQQQQQQTTTSRHYCCQFCSYSYVGPNSLVIESHVKYYHTMEFAALKKAVQQQKQLKMLKQQQQHQNSTGDANGASASSNGTPKSQAMDTSSASSDRLASLQSMVGINPQSVFAGLSTQSIIQGLQQAQAAQQQASGIPYTGTFASTLIDDGALRNMVEQQQQQQQQSMGGGEQQMASNMEAYGAMQRQVLNSALQQAAGVNPDSLRLIYQQLVQQQQQQQQTPLVATNPNSAFPGQLNGGSDSNNGSDQQQQQQMPTPQYQQIWQHYQQRLAQHLKSNPLAAAAAAAGGSAAAAAAAAFPTAARSASGEGAAGMSVVGGGGGKRASRESPHNNNHQHHQQQQLEQERAASPSSGGKKSGCGGDSRGWKKCDQCEFTAKGSHGLETHQRSTHSGSSPGHHHNSQHHHHHHHHQPHDSSNNNENEAAPMLSPFGGNKASNGDMLNRRGSGSEKATVTSSAEAQLLHPSSSRRKGSSSSSTSSSASSSGAKQMKCAETQTEGGVLMSSSNSNKQECPYCEVTFNDEMMHALHMSCHDKNDPFMCKVCGQHCHEKYYFNVHLLRGLHQNTNNNNNTTTTTTTSNSANSDGAASNGAAATGASNGRQNSSEGSTRVSPSPVEIRLSPR